MGARNTFDAIYVAIQQQFLQLSTRHPTLEPTKSGIEAEKEKRGDVGFRYVAGGKSSSKGVLFIVTPAPKLKEYHIYYRITHLSISDYHCTFFYFFIFPSHFLSSPAFLPLPHHSS